MQQREYKDSSAMKSAPYFMKGSSLKSSTIPTADGRHSVNDEGGMFDVFLHPGEYAVAMEPCIIRTILGSCVTVTLWHPIKKVGLMSHCLLPKNDKNKHTNDDVKPSGKYCDEVVALMFKALQDMNINPKECQAKIFGGGSMYPQHGLVEQTNIGQKNGEIARQLLIAHGIPILSESLFGMGHRRIAFDVSTGDVWVRHEKPAG